MDARVANRRKRAPDGSGTPRISRADPESRSLVELMRMPDRVHGNDEERGDAHPLPVSRRRFLQRSAMAVAGGVLFSCTGGRRIPQVSTSPTTTIDTRWPVKQVIYLMLENRSFDNLFGRFPGVNGATTGVAYGNEQALIPCPDWLPGDLQHDLAAALNCLNGDKLDGFGGGRWGAVYGYSQFHEAQIPNYYTGRETTRSRTIPTHRRLDRPTRTTSSSSPDSPAASSTTPRTSAPASTT